MKGVLTILGSGTSQGIPVIGCSCPVCTSKDKKDNRLRSAALISANHKNLVIDSGPDFRYQMLRENVKQLHGLLITHQHKDHIAGMDDVRAYNFLQNQSMNVFGLEEVHRALQNEFHYVFAKNKYPGIPRLNLVPIANETFEPIENFKVIPIQVLHHKMPVLGFRMGDLTYITDAKTISKEEIDKIKGTKTLVINALRIEEHISHFNLEEALQMIEKIHPQKAYLTHISHLFGKHKDILRILPKNVEPAYDGLKLDFYYE